MRILCEKVNIVGPFALTRLLEPSLKRGTDARVINVASVMHRFNEMPLPEIFLRWVHVITWKLQLTEVLMTIREMTSTEHCTYHCNPAAAGIHWLLISCTAASSHQEELETMLCLWLMHWQGLEYCYIWKIEVGCCDAVHTHAGQVEGQRNCRLGSLSRIALLLTAVKRTAGVHAFFLSVWKYLSTAVVTNDCSTTWTCNVADMFINNTSLMMWSCCSGLRLCGSWCS